jgi:3-dehydroquinate synthase
MPDDPPAAGREHLRVRTQRETEIGIGFGLLPRIWDEVARVAPGARRFALVVDERVAGLWPLPDPPEALRGVRCVVPAGERAKTRGVLADLQDRLLDLRRAEPVIVMGGGAVLDVGGFAAATVRRGLPWIAVATTVVAMADASVGGKVAVNHPRGKNLLGTFHPPALVLSDVATLDTLEARDRTAGLAEIYKCARLGDADLLESLRAGAPESGRDWRQVIGRAVTVKSVLVRTDERDAGVRRLLNYGHTLGHALEGALGNETVRHGEAIAIGMHAAARIAAGRGLIPQAQCDEQARDLAALGLPTSVPDGASADALLGALALDKKRAPGATHTWILPTGPIGAAVFDDVTEPEIRAIL